jgi:hypothetical protein
MCKQHKSAKQGQGTHAFVDAAPVIEILARAVRLARGVLLDALRARLQQRLRKHVAHQRSAINRQCAPRVQPTERNASRPGACARAAREPAQGAGAASAQHGECRAQRKATRAPGKPAAPSRTAACRTPPPGAHGGGVRGRISRAACVKRAARVVRSRRSGGCACASAAAGQRMSGRRARLLLGVHRVGHCVRRRAAGTASSGGAARHAASGFARGTRKSGTLRQPHAACARSRRSQPPPLPPSGVAAPPAPGIRRHSAMQSCTRFCTAELRGAPGARFARPHAGSAAAALRCTRTCCLRPRTAARVRELRASEGSVVPFGQLPAPVRVPTARGGRASAAAARPAAALLQA